MRTFWFGIIMTTVFSFLLGFSFGSGYKQTSYDRALKESPGGITLYVVNKPDMRHLKQYNYENGIYIVKIKDSQETEQFKKTIENMIKKGFN